MSKTFIICEKPDAALHMAEALDSSKKPAKQEKNGVPYYEIKRGPDRIMICSALGHLYEVDAKVGGSRRHYPVWDFVWKPKHQVERGQKKQERWIKAISELAKEADTYINACDFDIEGSLIGYMVLKYSCDGADSKAKRMKFSTLTKKELVEAYNNPMDQLDFPLVNAGMCRHEVDWLYGVNLSRALTQAAYKASQRYATLSTGRVQGPTLRYVVSREKDVSVFVPTPYWSIAAKAIVDGHEIEAEYEKEKIETLREANNVAATCSGKQALVKDLESRNYQLSPPTPFDLSSLQAEAYRHFGFTPSQTVGIAERLYLDALISYPRTSSQKLPPTIGYHEILKGLSAQQDYRELVAKLAGAGELKPNEGKKTDPAHPAVYPTGTSPPRKLEAREQKLFDLVVRRFLATFGPKGMKESSKAVLEAQGHTFFLRGSRILKKGWIEYYEPYAKFEEVTLPSLSVGQFALLSQVVSLEKYTQPLPRFNPSSLLRLMEDENLGTKATRAEIVETLYHRNYIRGERMEATRLAFKIIGLLSKYCPRVIDVGFTRELEKRMEAIELGEEKRERIVLQAVEHLQPIIEELKANEDQLGAELTKTIKEMRMADITLTAPCPSCGSELFVLRSRRTGKRFIGCSGMWQGKCKFALPLPQMGKLSLLQKTCPDCGFQMVQVRMVGRRPMTSCPKCFVSRIKEKAKEAKAESQGEA